MNISSEIKKPTTSSVKRCNLLRTKIIFIEIILLAFFLNTTSAKEEKPNFNVESRINTLHNYLEKFIPRNKWDRSFNSTNCTYESPQLKSKIRFIVLSLCLSVWLRTEHREADLEDDLCDDSMKLFSQNENYKDLYYNYYIIGNKKGIVGGRPLTCPYDEDFLKADHSSVITVGITYCFPGSSLKNNLLALQLTDEISSLVNGLKEKQFLTSDYELEFPDICRGSLLLEKINRIPNTNNISFYEHKQYEDLNISTRFDPTFFSKFLFLPKDSTPNDTNSSSPVKIQFPLPSNFSLPYSNVSSAVAEKIKIRFSWLSQGDVQSYDHMKPSEHGGYIYGFNPWSVRSNETFVQECWPDIMNFLQKEIPSYSKSIGNYFVFQDNFQVYGQIPTNYSSNLENDDLFVFIFIFHDHFALGRSDQNEGRVIWFANLFESIRNDIWKRLEYSQVSYEQTCYDMASLLDIKTLFTHLVTTDFTYPNSTEFGRSKGFHSCQYMDYGELCRIRDVD